MIDKPRALIAVATFRRAEQLEALLGSLVEAIRASANSANFDVLVIDNDPDASARSVVESADLPDLSYIVESTPGISAARNAAVERALTHDLMLFVDDDEIVTKNWLEELLNSQAENNADIVAGPVLPVYPVGAPDFLVGKGFFERAVRPDGTTITEAGCGNIMFRSSLFSSRSKADWFDEAFSFTGGEDAELTRRFIRDGAVAVWAAKAVVFEPVPAERLRLRWLSRRYRRLGAVEARLSTHRRVRFLSNLLGGGSRIALGAASLAIRFIQTGSLDSVAFKRIFRGVGFIESLFSVGHVEYRRLEGSKTGSEALK